jgi:CheY-like chemotaxis protein
VKPVDRGALLAAIGATAGEDVEPERYKILVVDDEAQAREYVSDLLTPLGFQVVTASGGREGIDMLSAEKPDLLILDLIMPDMTGFQVIDELRDTPDTSHIPILILTSKELSASDRRALRSTVDAVVSKGGREELLAQLQALCPAPAVI